MKIVKLQFPLFSVYYSKTELDFIDLISRQVFVSDFHTLYLNYQRRYWVFSKNMSITFEILFYFNIIPNQFWSYSSNGNKLKKCKKHLRLIFTEVVVSNYW